MFVFSLLGTALVSLILVLPDVAYPQIKPCCRQGATCTALCVCGCSPGDLSSEKMCLVKKDPAQRTATFHKEGQTEEIVLPLLENSMLQNAQPGDCGFVTAQMQPLCTKFEMEPPPVGQQAPQRKK